MSEYDTYGAEEPSDGFLTRRTIGQVRLFQAEQAEAGQPTTVGAYAFDAPTLARLQAKLGLIDGELFDDACQDRLAAADEVTQTVKAAVRIVEADQPSEPAEKTAKEPEPERGRDRKR